MLIIPLLFFFCKGFYAFIYFNSSKLFKDIQCQFYQDTECLLIHLLLSLIVLYHCLHILMRLCSRKHQAAFFTNQSVNSKNPHDLEPCGFVLELMVGIEPTTCSLRVSCSTPEPHQLINSFIILAQFFHRVNLFFLLGKNIEIPK